MTTLLASSLTGDQAIAAAVPALVVRVENIYESGGAFFSVDASAAWSADPFELTVRDAPDRRPRYAVAGYVAHINDAAVGAKQRMRSGHYTLPMFTAGATGSSLTKAALLRSIHRPRVSRIWCSWCGPTAGGCCVVSRQSARLILRCMSCCRNVRQSVLRP